MIARRDGRVLRLEHDGHTVVLETVDGQLGIQQTSMSSSRTYGSPRVNADWCELGISASCGKQKDTYVVAAFLWLAHPPTEIRVDRQNEDLDRDTAVELNGIDVELLRRVDLDHLLRVRVT